ncbi:hypothetical protein [Lactobacillus sp. M0396]|uniref:hypothetical protein n=1 Tax=Lactobacillus sp. M0396 TaxID=2751030 RepID=UPI0018DDFDC2|nr:hypothetical protein [Lactobacillus sp. M0396]MBI0033971.1 hypothetical protein [Lactobacillus sp. M0396]
MDKESSLHWNKPSSIEKTTDGRYILPIKTGMLLINKEQLNFLNIFLQRDYSLREIEKLFSNDIQQIDTLVEYFFQKGVLIDSQGITNKISIYSIFKRIYFWTIPKFIYDRVLKSIDKVAKNLNISYCTSVMILINLLSALPTIYLFFALKINLSIIERNWYMLLIGFVSAFVHEVFLSIYIRKQNRPIKRWFIKFVFGMFISLGTNWSSMMAESKEKRIKMFLFALNSVITVSSILAFISYVLYSCNQVYISYTLYLMTIANDSFVLLDIYPFLLKNDGYQLFQELTGTYRLRAAFFRCIVAMFYPKYRIEWYSKKNIEKIFILIWGTMFIFSMFGIIYASIHAIRIIF